MPRLPGPTCHRRSGLPGLFESRQARCNGSQLLLLNRDIVVCFRDQLIERMLQPIKLLEDRFSVPLQIDHECAPGLSGLCLLRLHSGTAASAMRAIDNRQPLYLLVRLVNNGDCGPLVNPILKDTGAKLFRMAAARNFAIPGGRRLIVCSVGRRRRQSICRPLIRAGVFQRDPRLSQRGCEDSTLEHRLRDWIGTTKTEQTYYYRFYYSRDNGSDCSSRATTNNRLNPGRTDGKTWNSSDLANTFPLEKEPSLMPKSGIGVDH